MNPHEHQQAPHTSWTCQAIYETDDDIKHCLCGTDANNNNRDNDQILGIIAPDAFFFSPQFTFNSKCKNTPPLHDLIFAGYLVQYSIIHPSPDFNSSTFAIGFGTHIAGDMSAFYNDQSYLRSKWPNWLNVWNLMRTVDTYVFQKECPCMKKMPTNISASAAQFISDATAFYKIVNPDFPLVTADEIIECVYEWSTFVNENLRIAQLTSRATNENELVVNDPYRATNFNQAFTNLQMAKNCSIEAIQYWIKLATASCASPKEALKDLLAYINYMITDEGMCQPSQKKNLKMY